MKNIKKMIWGIVLIVAAIVIALNSFDIINFDLFFDGWWTLFIIIPSIAGIIQDRDKSGSIFGLLIGVLLLLCAQDIVDFDFLWKLLVPAIVAYIGLKMIFSSKHKTEDKTIKVEVENNACQSGVAVFCGTEMNFENTVFEGANLTAVFGGVDCDLSRAIINCDCKINVCAVFGGIDIKVPSNVRVVSNVSCIFGGIDVAQDENSTGTYTIYIDGLCVFGGVDVE